MLLYIMWNVNDHKEHASHMTVTSDVMTDLAYLNGYSTAPKLSSVWRCTEGKTRYKLACSKFGHSPTLVRRIPLWWARCKVVGEVAFLFAAPFRISYRPTEPQNQSSFISERSCRHTSQK